MDESLEHRKQNSFELIYAEITRRVSLGVERKTYGLGKLWANVSELNFSK